MEIRHYAGSQQPNLGLDKATRDSLADYCRIRWPAHAAKLAAREWDLTLDEAKGVVAGRTSVATLDRIYKHKNGGWSVILPVLGAVVGHSIEDHFNQETTRLRNARRDNEARLRRVGESVRNLRSWAPVAGDGSPGAGPGVVRRGASDRG